MTEQDHASTPPSPPSEYRRPASPPDAFPPPGGASPPPGAYGGWPPPWYPLPPQPSPYHKPRDGRTVALIAVAATALILVLVIAAAAFAVGRYTASNGPFRGNTTAGSQSSGVSAKTITSVTSKVAPGIVDINTVLGFQNAAGAGTGIVLSADGLVLTNNHVVAGATSIRVTDVGNGQTYPGSVVGYDRTDDIAVVRLTGASGLRVAPLGNSSAVKAGARVVAIGNAEGAGGAPAAIGGTVTGLNRSVSVQDDSTGALRQLTNMIEITAALVPGDSGGPLASTAGKVIGMDSAGSAISGQQPSGQATDATGYAVPIDRASEIAKQIESGQASDTVHIGATAFLGVQSGNRGVRRIGGALVLGAVPGSPAQTAGLVAGDVIGSVNGQSVDSTAALTALLDDVHPGDHVTIGWTDTAGQAHTATVVAAVGPVG